MQIYSKKRKDRNENLVVFGFTSIEQDFNPYIEALESYTKRFHDDDYAAWWSELVKKIKNRCDTKYANGDVVASSSLFADEYAEFIELASILLIQSATPIPRQYKISMPCPSCQREGVIDFTHNEATQENVCSCRLCGFERNESEIENIKPKTQDSFYAGIIFSKRVINGEEYCAMNKFKYETTFDEAKSTVENIKSDKGVQEIIATWFDKDTLEIKVIR
ncbi:MAG: hypothetical protein IJ419_07995 [Agathobacter sp.]|nr:hypothetical protein [Agathobacter sp.]